MIFITTGTQEFPFNRLLKKIDELIVEKKISEDVFAQIGYSEYIPKNYRYEKFLSMDIFDDLVDKADLIVSHAGGGVICTSLVLGKRICVVPRLAKFGEHIDDHQLEIAGEYERKNLLEVCYDVENLQQAIENARNREFVKFGDSKRKIVGIIEEFVGGKND